MPTLPPYQLPDSTYPTTTISQGECTRLSWHLSRALPPIPPFLNLEGTIRATYFFNVYLSSRTSTSRGGTGGRGTQDLKQAPRAVSTEPDTGLELTDREIVT